MWQFTHKIESPWIQSYFDLWWPVCVKKTLQKESRLVVEKCYWLLAHKKTWRVVLPLFICLSGLWEVENVIASCLVFVAAPPQAGVHTSSVRSLRYGWWAYALGERTTPRLGQNSKIITVDGNLASGKGAVAQKLADKLGNEPLSLAFCKQNDPSGLQSRGQNKTKQK